MNDPYMPVEKRYQLVRGALGIINEYGFPVHILTKSDLVLRDLDLLLKISRPYAAVSFTITTVDDQLAAVIEPAAPRPSARLKAMELLAEAGILTGVTMMPILPFLEDDSENIRKIVRQSASHGASYIIPAFGVTLRPGSREYFFRKLDSHFPGVKEKYIRAYGDSYECSVPDWRELAGVFQEEIKVAGIASRIPTFEPRRRSGNQAQMSFFNS
jgi:DNA repair photolyase